ncbi:unnamed protein product, partial [Linum tenue]
AQPNSSPPSFLLSELSISYLLRRRRRRSSKTPFPHCLSVCQSVSLLAQMARVGVTTRPRPFPLASSSSTPDSPPPSSSSTKRRKFNHRGAAGGREREFTSGGGDSGTSTAAGDSSSGRRSGEIERCFTSPSAAADAAAEEEEVDRLCSDDSCCSSNGSSEGAFEFSDLQEDEQAEVEIESPTNCGGSERERFVVVLLSKSDSLNSFRFSNS